MSWVRRAAALVAPEALKRADARVRNYAWEVAKASSHPVVRIQQCGPFEVAYRIGTTDEDVIRHSFDNDIFFTGVPEYEPKDTDVMMDIGGHIGTFTLLAASKVPRGKVYGIEPCRESFELLRINKALNAASNIECVNAAVGDKSGRTVLHYGPGNWGHSIVAARTAGGEEVAAMTLSEVLDSNEISTCHFVKFNCEGGEFPIVLASSRDVLRKFETMLVLYHCDLAKGQNERELVSHLEAAGFSTSLRNVSEKRGWIVAERR